MKNTYKGIHIAYGKPKTAKEVFTLFRMMKKCSYNNCNKIKEVNNNDK